MFFTWWRTVDMATCPKCKNELRKATKRWNYGPFNVKAYICNCGQRFREYRQDSELKFVLIKEGKISKKAKV